MVFLPYSALFAALRKMAAGAKGQKKAPAIPAAGRNNNKEENRVKRFLALILAVAMMAAMSVVAMAGGGGDDYWSVEMTNTKTGKSYFRAAAPLAPGEQLQLQLYYHDENGHTGVWNDVTWESTDTSRVAISGNVATYLGVDGDDAEVTVIPHVNSVPEVIGREPGTCGYIFLGGKTQLRLQPDSEGFDPESTDSVFLDAGKTMTITATVKNTETGEEIEEGNVTWSSSKPDSVSIEETGPRTAAVTMKNDSAHITAEYSDSNGHKRTDVIYILFQKTPTTPSKPSRPSTSSTAVDSPHESERDSNTAAQEAAVDAMVAANDGKSASKVQNVATAAGTTVPAVPVKLYGLSASLSIDTMEAIATGKTGLKVNLDNGAAEVLIPAGFTMPKNTGVLAYPLGHQKDPYGANLMKDAVKEDSAKTEVHKLGGGTLPTTATVTIKTKLTGAVNIYRWDEDTRKAALVASATASGGKVTFAAKQLGNFIITTGTI